MKVLQFPCVYETLSGGSEVIFLTVRGDTISRACCKEIFLDKFSYSIVFSGPNSNFPGVIRSYFLGSSLFCMGRK
jgi:hypothetical protein